MANNPIVLSVPGNAKGIINAMSNASYYQRVTLIWGDKRSSLEGTGEGQPMLTPAGDNIIELMPTDEGYQITAIFEYSESGKSGPLHLGTVQKPVVTNNDPFTITQVTVEDHNDNDNNDTYLTIVAISFPPGAGTVGTSTGGSPPVATLAQEGAAPASAAPAGPATPAPLDSQLETHAKSYYNNPLVQGGDEHYFQVPYNTSTAGSMGAQCMSWSVAKATFFDQQRPFGGYLNLYVKLDNCEHPDMHDLVLTLTATFSYWHSRPTGYRSASWTWKVSGTGLYTVVNVTT